MLPKITVLVDTQTISPVILPLIGTQKYVSYTRTRTGTGVLMWRVELYHVKKFATFYNQRLFLLTLYSVMRRNVRRY